MDFLSEIQKREMTVGEILKMAWQVFKKALGPLVAVFAMGVIVLTVACFLLFLVMATSFAAGGADVKTLTPLALFLTPIFLLVVTLISLIAVVVFIIWPFLTIKNVLTTFKGNIFNALKKSFGRVIPLLWFGVLSAFILFLLPVVIIVAARSAVSDPSKAVAVVVLTVLVISLEYLLAFPWMFLGSMDVMLSARGGLEAIKNVVKGTKGRYWRIWIKIFLTFLFLTLINFGVVLAFGLIGALLQGKNASLVVQMLPSLASLFFAAYFFCTHAVLYFNIIGGPKNAAEQPPVVAEELNKISQEPPHIEEDVNKAPWDAHQ